MSARPEPSPWPDVWAEPQGATASRPENRDGLIGPHALTEVVGAGLLMLGEVETRALFAEAGLEGRLDHPPETMVDEEEVARLHGHLFRRLGPGGAAEVAALAGTRTGEYLLSKRIPKPAQWLLRLMPKGRAARLLTRAIARHAWTFAGSGTFGWRAGDRCVELSIAHSPACRHVRSELPACHYYRAVFERLYREMLGSGIRVREVCCEATGQGDCRFRVEWGSRACQSLASGGCDCMGDGQLH